MSGLYGNTLHTASSTNESNALPRFRTGNEYTYRAAVGGFMTGYKGKARVLRGS